MTFIETVLQGGSVAEWLACWIQAQKARVQIAAVALLGNSPRQTVYDGRTEGKGSREYLVQTKISH